MGKAHRIGSRRSLKNTAQSGHIRPLHNINGRALTGKAMRRVRQDHLCG
jgi:hypothetical protein